MSGSTYHREIDGLRALSVIAIILFHLGITTFQGGFIGVDIFFVISGFLITRIIASDLASGQFSFRDFYIRRGTRILPALIATILLVLPVAIYLQHPAELVHTAQESIYALFSLSNIFYLTESSYWAVEAERYALLHTWSLGVEEQFYLVFPLLLMVAHRILGGRGALYLLIGIAILGIVSSELMIRINATAAFYFAPLRFYEFAIGGLVALLPSVTMFQKNHWVSGTITATGLAVILFACIVFNSFLPFPGTLILIPILGAVLVLLAGASPIARVALINPLMSWIGKISYSLYLVHWPIIVFYRDYFGASLSFSDLAVLCLAILLAGALLNRFVERKYRLARDSKTTSSGVSARAVLVGTAVAALLIIVASAALISSKGWPSRMPAGAQSLLDINLLRDMVIRKKLFEKNCKPSGEIFCGKRQPDETNILLLGDSRALDIYIALQTAYPNTNIMASYAMGCAPVFSREAAFSIYYPNCYQFNQLRLKKALEAPTEDIIFIAQSLLKPRLESIVDTVYRLKAAGKTIYVTGEFDIISLHSPIHIAVEALRFPDREDNLERYLIDNPFSLDFEFAERIRSAGAIYISYKPLFYDGQYHFSDRATGKLLTFDGKHLNRFGAIEFGRYLRKHYPLPSRLPPRPD